MRVACAVLAAILALTDTGGAQAARVVGACAPMDMAIAAGMLESVNAARAQAGVNAVALDGPLVLSAHLFACELSGLGVLTHEPTPGNTPAFRARVAGSSHCAVVENIAQGQRTGAHVLSGWMARTGHRRNILDPRMTSFGVGAVDDPVGAKWVMVLGGPC